MSAFATENLLFHEENMYPSGGNFKASGIICDFYTDNYEILPGEKDNIRVHTTSVVLGQVLPRDSAFFYDSTDFSSLIQQASTGRITTSNNPNTDAHLIIQAYLNSIPFPLKGDGNTVIFNDAAAVPQLLEFIEKHCQP
jgi:hypothetical protein